MKRSLTKNFSSLFARHLCLVDSFRTCRSGLDRVRRTHLSVVSRNPLHWKNGSVSQWSYSNPPVIWSDVKMSTENFMRIPWKRCFHEAPTFSCYILLLTFSIAFSGVTHCIVTARYHRRALTFSELITLWTCNVLIKHTSVFKHDNTVFSLRFLVFSWLHCLVFVLWTKLVSLRAGKLSVRRECLWADSSHKTSMWLLFTCCDKARRQSTNG